MVKHIVLFKLIEFESPEKKSAKLTEIKDALLELPSKIKELSSMEVGINANSNEEYDFCLTADLENMEAVQIYATHPDHVAVGKIIKVVLEKRACVDYEI